MLAEREEELLSVDRPEFDGLVIRGCHQSLSITGEVNTAHSGCVSSEHCGVCLPANTQNINEMENSQRVVSAVCSLQEISNNYSHVFTRFS